MTVIYKITDPNSGFIIYVGKTISFEKRAVEHLGGNFGLIGKYVLALLASGKKPLIEILETCEDEISSEREGYWIDYFRDAGMPLLNTASVGSITAKRRHNIIRKTKYPFATILVGEQFEIQSEDFNSMATSLRAYNSRHNKNIQVCSSEHFERDKLFIERVK